MKGYPIGYVIWDDACAAHDRCSVDIHQSPQAVLTVGLIIHQDKKGITLAVDAIEDGRFRDHHFIPRGMIRRVCIVKRDVVERQPCLVKFPGRTFEVLS